jgi:GMP synthase (glutamine-hydrolysing)
MSTDSKTILAVVHQGHSRTGRVGDLLEQRGFRLERCCPNTGDKLPEDLSGYAGVVVYGGPMSANDEVPGIRAELDWLPKVLDADVPYLGLCLGAQLVAKVLGARVDVHPEGLAEIGYVKIEPVYQQCRIIPQSLTDYHWHREGFDLPSGATLLARGENFPNQAFRYGRNCYGLQFHPEVTLEMKEIWTVKAAERLKLPGAMPREQHIELHPVHDPARGNWIDRFLDHWLAPKDQKLAHAAS